MNVKTACLMSVDTIISNISDKIESLLDKPIWCFCMNRSLLMVGASYMMERGTEGDDWPQKRFTWWIDREHWALTVPNIEVNHTFTSAFPFNSYQIIQFSIEQPKYWMPYRSKHHQIYVRSLDTIHIDIVCTVCTQFHGYLILSQFFFILMQLYIH